MPVGLKDFYAAVSGMNLIKNDQVIELKNDKKGNAILAGRKLTTKTAKVDGFEMRRTFYAALVNQGAGEDVIKMLYNKLNLNNPKLSHKPLTAREIRSCLDAKAEMQLEGPKKAPKQVAADRMSGGFVVMDKEQFAVPEHALKDEFVVIENDKTETIDGKEFVVLEKGKDIPESPNIKEKTKADSVRDQSQQQRRDLLSTAIKAQCKVTDAQLQRLSVDGLKDFLASVNIELGNKETAKNLQNPSWVAAEIDKLSVSKTQINQDELLTSINRLETDKVFSGKVKITDDAKMKQSGTDYQNLLADLVFDGDTVLHDTMDPNQRLLVTLKKNTSTIKTLMMSSSLERTGAVSPLALAMLEKMRSGLMDLLGFKEDDLIYKESGDSGESSNKSGIWGLFQKAKSAVKQAGSQLEWHNGITEKINKALDEFDKSLQQGQVPPKLAELNATIETLVKSGCDSLQSVMTEAFEGVVGGKDVDMSSFLSKADPESLAILNERFPGIIPEPENEPAQAEEAKPAEPQPKVEKQYDPELEAQKLDSNAVEGHRKNANYPSWKKCGSKQQQEEFFKNLSPQDRMALIFAHLASKYENNKELQIFMGHLQGPNSVLMTAIGNNELKLSINELEQVFINEVVKQLGLELTPIKAFDKEVIDEFAKSKLYDEWVNEKNLENDSFQGDYFSQRSVDDRKILIIAHFAHKYENDAALQEFLAKLFDAKSTMTDTIETPNARLDMSEVEALGQDVLNELNIELTEKKSSPLDKLKAMTLDEVVSKGPLDPDQGYGKFLLNAMKTYFKSVSDLDKRSMFASMLRNSPSIASFKPPVNPQQKVQGGKFDPKVDYNQPVSGDVEESDPVMDMAAATLGAFFKGAGPIMQKQLQQLASMDIPKTLQKALVDMRSNLLPMPDTIVHAMLAKMVEDSQVETDPDLRIDHIDVKKTLGAASVAQSLLCEITNGNGVKSTVVIKLVRPDAAYRADREKQVFLDAAGDDEGMKASFKGRLERIMEEFDLEIETSNAEAGKVYDKEGTIHDYEFKLNMPFVKQTENFNDVKSVGINKTNPTGSHSSMVMDLVNGDTLDRKMKYFENATHASQKKFHEISSSPKTLDDKANIRQFALENGEKLMKLHDELVAAKEKAVHFAHQWVSEALYGGGFFHGDAHAGNIMISDKTLTAIDYGNATKLTPREQKMILRVIAACQKNDTDTFLDSFRELLSPEGKQAFDARRAEVSGHISVLMDKKTEDSQVGLLIGAAIVQLQKLEIEIPAPIFNFSYSQTMIQGTIDELQRKIDELRTHMTSVSNSIQTEYDFSTLAEMEEASRIPDNYSLKADHVLGQIVQDFLETGKLPTNFDDFRDEMEEIGKGDDEVRRLYQDFVKTDVFKAAQKQAIALNQLNLLMEVDQVVLKDGKLEESKPAFEIFAKIARKTEELANDGTQNQKKKEVESLLPIFTSLQSNYAKEQSRLPEAERKEFTMETFKAILGKTDPQVVTDFNKAKAEFAKNLQEIRKAKIAKDKETVKELGNLEAQNNKLKEIKNDLVKHKDIEKNKKAKLKDEREFLSTMASNILDNKMKTAASLGFLGTLKFFV